MSDTGNVNGGAVDDPVPNSTVVGVDMLSGAGNEPESPPLADDEGHDPGEHTIDDRSSNELT